MPTTLPGISVTKAGELLQTQDRIIKAFPGGRVGLRQGRTGRHRDRSGADPRCSRPSSISSRRKQWRPGVTVDGLIAEMDKALQFPGVSNAWTMPIKARIDMLSTGIRTPVGVKVFGTDLAEIDTARPARSRQIIKAVPGHLERLCRARSSAATSSTSTPDREALARYGLTVRDVQDIIATALGGQTVTTTVEGRERYTVNVRYPRDLRTIRKPSPARCWCRCRPAARCRSARSPRSRWPAARPRSAPRTASSRPTSTSTSATATSAATSPRREQAVQAGVSLPPGYYVHLERPVRISGTRRRAAQGRGSGDAARSSSCCST